jgi:hypothetical protein
VLLRIFSGMGFSLMPFRPNSRSLGFLAVRRFSG